MGMGLTKRKRPRKSWQGELRASGRVPVGDGVASGAITIDIARADSIVVRTVTGNEGLHGGAGRAA